MATTSGVNVYEENLQVLRKHYPSTEKIISVCSYVQLGKWSESEGKYVSTKTGGPLFFTKSKIRSVESYNMVIMNQQSPDMFIEEVTPEIAFRKIDGKTLTYRKDKMAYSLSAALPEDNRTLYNTLSGVVALLKDPKV